MLSLDLMLTILLSLALLLILSLVLALMFSQRHSRRVMLSLLSAQVQENQSLRNQLRASDPMTLHALQAATNQPSTSEDEYHPSYEEGLQYYEDLTASNFRTEDLDDDLVASGWSPVTVSDSGGNPVNFERPS